MKGRYSQFQFKIFSTAKTWLIWSTPVFYNGHEKETKSYSGPRLAHKIPCSYISPGCWMECLRGEYMMRANPFISQSHADKAWHDLSHQGGRYDSLTCPIKERCPVAASFPHSVPRYSPWPWNAAPQHPRGVYNFSKKREVKRQRKSKIVTCLIHVGKLWRLQ